MHLVGKEGTGLFRRNRRSGSRRVSPCKHPTLQPLLHTHILLREGGATQGLSLADASFPHIATVLGLCSEGGATGVAPVRSY